jgi:hypothetical protein
VAITDAFRRRFDRYVESACGGGGARDREGGEADPGADPSPRTRPEEVEAAPEGDPPRATSAERIEAANDFCLLPQSIVRRLYVLDAQDRLRRDTRMDLVYPVAEDLDTYDAQCPILERSPLDHLWFKWLRAQAGT